MKVGLETVVEYLPDEVQKRSDFAFLDPVIPPGQEEIWKGPEELRRARGEKAVELLGENAARKALEAADLTPSDIDFIIASNIGGHRVGFLIGTHIHHALGFPTETPVLNINNFCASFMDGINVAWKLVLSGEYKRILVVCATSVAQEGWGVDQTSFMAKNFGDGAGAGVVSTQNLKFEFLSYTNKTYGELYDHMYFLESPVANPELMAVAGIKKDKGNFLYADEWFFTSDLYQGENFAIDGIEEALKAAKLKISDVDMVVMHHFQEGFHMNWVEGGIKRGISKEKWESVSEGYHRLANCGNVDIAAGLARYLETGRISKGANIALFAPGAGGHTPSMIIKAV